MEKWISQFKHLDPVERHVVTAGGLSFNTPKLSHESVTLEPKVSEEEINKFNNIINLNNQNPIITNIGKITSFEMAKQSKAPIELACIKPDNLDQINVIGKNSGIMDMWIKKYGSNNIVIPKELDILRDIIEESYKFEEFTNKDILNWNMWLLVDIRPVRQFHTQRNSGFHYDGMALSGKYKGCPVTSIYSWTNKLPTQFYTGIVEFPDNFKPEHNANIIAQKQIKHNDQILTTKPYHLYKFDATTVHTGVETSESINDRVFVRICFTAPTVLFDRIGNTINPFLSYDDLCWRHVKDPVVTFKSLTRFNTPQEFKNLWDVACQGHPAFACQYEGKTSFEHKLIKKLKSNYSPSFINKIVEIYNEDVNKGNIVSHIRKELLLMKYS
jgi:hypothetical protein